MERFLEKIQIQDNGCWHWTGFVDGEGYGRFALARGKTQQAHRISVELHGGIIPAGFQVDHTCHKTSECHGGRSCLHRRCVNPDHLEPVTKLENGRRGHHRTESGQSACAAHQRSKTHCPSGHEYTPENTYHKKNERACLECRRKEHREWSRRKSGFYERRAQ